MVSYGLLKATSGFSGLYSKVRVLVEGFDVKDVEILIEHEGYRIGRIGLWGGFCNISSIFSPEVVVVLFFIVLLVHWIIFCF